MYVLSFFKKGDTIQGGTLFKEISIIAVKRKQMDRTTVTRISSFMSHLAQTSFVKLCPRSRHYTTLFTSFSDM